MIPMEVSPLLDVAVITAIALLWALLLLFIWGFGLLEHLVGQANPEWSS